MQCVRREGGRVALGRNQAAERGAHVVGRDSRGLEKGPALHELDHGAARGQRCAAALRVKARLGDALPLHSHGHAHEIAAGRPARRAAVRPVREGMTPARRAQMILELHSLATLTDREARADSLIPGPSLCVSRPYMLSRTSPGREFDSL